MQKIGGCFFPSHGRYVTTASSHSRNQLSIDLASAFVSFVESNYGHSESNKWDKLKITEFSYRKNYSIITYVVAD
jgi:hypothetical protein